MNMLTLSKNHFSSIFHISRLAKKKTKEKFVQAMKEAAVPNTPSRKTSLW